MSHNVGAFAHIANDAISRLATKGLPPTPTNYEAVFSALCQERGVNPPPDVGAENGHVVLADEVGDLLVGLARVGSQISPELCGVLRGLRMARAGGQLDQRELLSFVDAVQAASDDLSTPEPGTSGGDLVFVERVAALCRTLVPVADPQGTHKADVVPALRGLATAKSGAEATQHVEALTRFAAARRTENAAQATAFRGCELRNDELIAVASTCMDFMGRTFDEMPEFGEALEQVRAQLEGGTAKDLQRINSELAEQLRAVQGAVTPVQQQKSVIKGVLRNLAMQLSAASDGSVEFVEKASAIQARLESANDLTELRELQDTLINETASAAASASSMKDKLGTLSTQVADSQAQIDRLERALVESRQKMNLDQLTRVPNRRALDGWVAGQLYEGTTLRRGYTLLVIDLDHFKKVNDTHGHLAGDRVLAETARRLKMGIRDIDFLARYGGEEFVLVLPDCNLEIGTAVAGRLCQLLRRKPINHEGTDITVTASIGVGTACAGEAFDVVFERADQCVYIAKESGRNQAVPETRLPA